MCPFDSIVSSSAEVHNAALDQFWNVLLLLSGVVLSIRSLFATSFKAKAFSSTKC